MVSTLTIACLTGGKQLKSIPRGSYPRKTALARVKLESQLREILQTSFVSPLSLYMARSFAVSY
jgi:hypothetical protein